MAFPLVRYIGAFNVDSPKVPQALSLILREDIRDLFKRRRMTAACVLSNAGIDALLNLWWKHHQNIIRAASIRPEWDWRTLSLYFDQNVSRPVNFYDARKDFLVLLARPHYLNLAEFRDWNYDIDHVVPRRPSDNGYLGRFHSFLYHLFYDLFSLLILENKEPTPSSEYTDADARISPDIVVQVKDYIDGHSSTVQVSDTKQFTGAFWLTDIYKLLGSEEPIPFNKLPKAIFDRVCALLSSNDGGETYGSFIQTLEEFIISNPINRELFIADVYKSVGANQLAGDKGPVKTTVTNKLVKLYYDWLSALSFGFSGNPLNLFDNTFESCVSRMKDFVFYTDMPLKERRPDGQEGFNVVNRGSFEQIFARLQENVKGSFSRESFIVSFHPCDMITCSLGYNWSSCQSWIDDFTDLPAGYGVGSSYSGGYNRGNFQFLCGNCFIAFVPHEKLPNVPQYLWAKKKRCLIWVGDNLDCMRQNYFYPGKPTDQETLAFGKVIREYIQNICAPFNFSNGTMDWKVKKGVGKHWSSSVEEEDFSRFEEYFDPCGGRYDDPIMAISYLKTAQGTPTLYYALTFPKLDTGKIQGQTSSNSAASFFVHTHNVCPVCGKHTTHEGLCSNCAKELIEHNGRMIHPSDLVSLKVDGHTMYFDIDELDKLDNYVQIEDGTSVEFKSAYKVFMPSGIKYFTQLPDYVKQCKVCKEYFHPSFMLGDVCIEHFSASLSSDSSDIVVNLEEVLDSFIKGNLSFDCNDTDNLLILLNQLNDKGIKWISGARAIDYVPRTDSAKKMYLSTNSGKLLLSSQAKSTVIKVSNLFKKGGE